LYLGEGGGRGGAPATATDAAVTDRPCRHWDRIPSVDCADLSSAVLKKPGRKIEGLGRPNQNRSCRPLIVGWWRRFLVRSPGDLAGVARQLSVAAKESQPLCLIRSEISLIAKI
jgi:hypothetical protein